MQVKYYTNPSCLLPRAEVANSNAYMVRADKWPSVTEGVEGSVQTGRFVPHLKRAAPIQLPLMEARSSEFSREIANLDFR